MEQPLGWNDHWYGIGRYGIDGYGIGMELPLVWNDNYYGMTIGME